MPVREESNEREEEEKEEKRGEEKAWLRVKASKGSS